MYKFLFSSSFHSQYFLSSIHQFSYKLKLYGVYIQVLNARIFQMYFKYTCTNDEVLAANKICGGGGSVVNEVRF